MNKDEALVKLRRAMRAAVEYVGMANYESREQHALSEIDRNFIALGEEKYDEIGFSEKNR